MQRDERKSAHKKAGRANKVVVRVFANKVRDEVVFTHDWAANGGHAQDPPIDLPKKSGPWDIDLQLHDSTGLGLEFESANPDDVMWVRKKKGCPTRKGDGGQLEFKSVTTIGTNGKLDLLEVTNANKGNACKLHFMLRFKAGSEPYQYDPIIRNRGTV
jgi:hypothetical protein